MEKFDVYNRIGNKTGRIEYRKRKLPNGDFKLGVHVYLCNSQKEFLIQKRSNKKEILPGIWDIHMGHAIAGETPYDTMFREIEEELGVKLASSDVRARKRFVWSEKNYILDIFFVVGEINISECILQEDEVDAVKYIDAKGLKKLIDKMRRPIEYKQLVCNEIDDLMTSMVDDV